MSKKFEVGDTVFLPRTGVGEIASCEAVTVVGHEVQVFTIIPRIPVRSSATTIHRIPVDRAERSLLPLASKEQILKALSIVAQPSKNSARMWAKRSESYTEALKSGDLFLIAGVYRDSRKNDISEEDLSFSEKEYKEESLRTLAAHISYAMNVSVSEAEDMVRNAGIGSTSLEKAKENLDLDDVDLVNIQSQSLAVKEKYKLASPSLKRGSGKKAAVIPMQIDRSKIDIEKPSAFEHLELARRAFAGKHNQLVLYVIDHLYTANEREAGLAEYISQRGLAKASLAPARSEVKKLFNAFAAANPSQPETQATPVYKETEIKRSTISTDFSTMAIPLEVALKMRMLDEETFLILREGRNKPKTLGDVFKDVSRDTWPNIARKNYGLEENQASSIKSSLNKALESLSVSVK